ncbi:MAG: DUF898 domain-containing protein [Desulfobacter sp.]|nr:MAG: DUF898 domain-containing protein [Desulfobacter sp.]
MANYNIVYKGRILDGYSKESVKAALVENFDFTVEKASQLLNSGRVYIEKDLPPQRAKEYGIALKKAGLNVVLTRSVPAETDPAPHRSPEPELAAPVMEKSPMDQTGQAPPESGRAPITRTVQTRALPFEFMGTGSEYFKIWIVNLILSILTLGIYSAWAKVRRKQYFYGSTLLNGSSFEYLADPKNILKGRIIVAAFFIGYSVVSKIFPLAGTILSLLFVIIMPWLVVRSLAFNARNSAYKNIRFGFQGSVGEAAKVFILFPLLAGLTLGILSPWAIFRQKKFIVENYSYGTASFEFTATHRDYYAMVLWALIPIIIGAVLMGIASVIFPPVASLVAIVLYLYLFAYFSVKTTNLIFNSTLLGRHSFDADLEIKGYLGLIIVNTLASVVTLGIFYPWAHVRTVRYKLDHLVFMAKGDLDNFIAQEQEEVSALGEEAGDFFDLDIGL